MNTVQWNNSKILVSTVLICLFLLNVQFGNETLSEFSFAKGLMLVVLTTNA